MKKTLIKSVKILAIISIIVGVLNCIEGFFPYRMVNTTVLSKDTHYDLELDRTSFDINFEKIKCGVTQEIYNFLNEGDSVLLSVRYFNHEIDIIQRISDNRTFTNNVGDVLALIIFSIIYFIASLLVLLMEKISLKVHQNYGSDRKVIEIIIGVGFIFVFIFSLINLINMISPSYSSI